MHGGNGGGDQACPRSVEGPSGPPDGDHPDCPDERSEHLVGGDAGEAQHRGEPEDQDPQRGVAGGGLDVAYGQRRVGTGGDRRRVGGEQVLLGATVQVAVGLCEAQAVCKQVRSLVVVDAVA